MNLAEAIHQRWAAAPALCALTPADRLLTGNNPDPALPYAVLTRSGSRPEQRCNDHAAVDCVTLRIELYFARYDEGAAAVDALKAAFDRTDFAAGDLRVLNVRATNDSERQNDDGVWQFACELACTIVRDNP